MIRTELDASTGVGVVTIARPERKNALTPDMSRELVRAIRDAGSRARALVLAGAGDVFCAGFDLSLCRENSDALGELLRELSAAVSSMRELPIPVVIAAHGAALAGGCALLGGADIVVSHADAKLGYPVVKLGISPAVSAPFLTQAIGNGPARQRLLDTALIDGREALELGLVHELVDASEAVLPRAMELARAAASKPTPAMRATKALLNELSPTDAPRGLQASLSLVGSAEERERLSALWAKR